MSNTLYKVAVLGGGSFGTAIANIVADNGHEVTLWMRDDENAALINSKHSNERYLPGVNLNPSLKASTDLANTVKAADIVYIAIPSAAYRAVVRQCQSHVKAGQIWISTTKGVEQKGFLLMHQVLKEEIPQARIGVLSGPNLAKEIVQKMPAATVVASADEELCRLVQANLANGYFRVYANQDVYGVELAGSLKNIYAIATGMADAAGTGQNTKSFLITRSLAEMSRFAHNLGANPMTFIGLAGVGDLVVTCSSPLSRNYQIGYSLGSGLTLKQAITQLGQTAEGVNTVKYVKLKAEELGVYMPLVAGLYEILFNERPWEEVVIDLMHGEHSDDVEFVLN